MAKKVEQRRLQAALTTLMDHTGTTEFSDVADDGLIKRAASATEMAAELLRDCESSTARLRGALDRVGDGVVVCDEDGAEVYRNAKAITLAGARLGDVVAARAVDEALRAALGGKCPEETIELYSPTRRNLVIRAWPIRGGTEPIGAVATVEDVSERRRLEAIRRDFVANVSHELKTPVGALSLLAETLDGEDDVAVVGRLAARISTEAARLNRIIDDLLDLSRIETNETPSSDTHSIGLLLHEAIEPLQPMADRRSIRIDVDESRSDVALNGDRRDLVSAIGNLVENAVKYSEDGKLVSVRTESSEGSIAISVADQGVGIPRREQERVFERFYRVDRARSRSTGGTGLGLSIVRHVASNHGGSVELVSEEGVGSTFVLRLPVAPPQNGEDWNA